MAEELKTAETTTTPVAKQPAESGADSHADVDKVNEVSFDDTPATADGNTDKGTATDTKEETPKQTREQNAENARRRREEERAKELQKVREQAIIETLKGKNPYTGEDIKDTADVTEYILMREIEEKGGDPLADFSKFQKNKEREKEQQAVKESEKAEWYAKDREDFVTKHPEVTLDELVQDPDFADYSEGKVGKIPLAQIYERYIGFVGKYDEKSEQKAKQKAQQLLANQKASVGALSSSGTSESEFITKEQAEKMSPSEMKKNFEKIRASMAKWKT